MKRPLIYLKDTMNRVSFGALSPKYAELVFINPSKIEMVLGEGSAIKRKHTGQVLAGDWDIDRFDIGDFPKYQICKKHFVDGLSWADAGAISNMKSLLAVQPSIDRCETLKDVYKRYSELDVFFEHLKSGGAFYTRKQIKGDKWFREKGGIYIHFGRHGEAIFGGGGCHRLSIAKILKLPLIPIQVGVVHLDAIEIWRSSLINDAGVTRDGF